MVIAGSTRRTPASRQEKCRSQVAGLCGELRMESDVVGTSDWARSYGPCQRSRWLRCWSVALRTNAASRGGSTWSREADQAARWASQALISAPNSPLQRFMQ